uniref:Uncharacterized protein n=1 Tax=Panagrolaimus sp. PS1159 TaxID=55785 RepID=A0AC35FQH0_9BILA
MVVHIGIYQSSLYQIIYVSSFDSLKNKSIFAKVYDVVDEQQINFGVIFEDIISSINDKLGYACIYFEKQFDNNFYKSCIESGINSGFEGVEILSFYANKFLQAIINTNYKPKCNDYIWLAGIKGGFTWQKNKNGKFELEHWLPWNSETEMKKMKYATELFKNPKAIFFDPDVYVNEWEAKEFFPNSKIYLCNQFYSDNNMEIPLIKARIMAADMNVTVCDIGNTLNEEINVWYDKKAIIRFSEFSHLPCEKFVKIVKRIDEKVLKIHKQHSAEEIQLPDFDRFLVTISFDVNGIYSVLFKELPKLSKIDAEIELLYSKLENKAFAELHLLNFNKQYSIPKNIDLSDDKINAVGIDLGGMHCCAAVGRRNGIDSVALDNTGERLLPAFVGFDEKHEKCGAIVIKRLRNHAKTSIFGLKKIIGRKYNEVVIDKTWPFKIINVENDEIRIQIKIKDNESISKYPEEVLAVILKLIKNKVQDFQGKELGRVVLAIPQSFNEKQRNATFISAVLAGWKSIHFLPEPIAVAFAYFADKTFPTNSSVLVVDLGAQSMDVSVLNVDNGQIYVHTNYSSSQINGEKFDTVLAEYFGIKLETDFGIKLDETKMQKLMMKCSEIKKDLSHTSDAWLDVDGFDLSFDGKISITQKKFEELSSLLLFKIKETIKFTLQKGHIIKFDKIFYVGGGCRMPMIKELLQNMFPNVEHCFQINPEEVIAIGATYYAYYLNSSTRNLISATVNNSFVFDILQMFIRQKTEVTKIFEPK